MGKTEKVGNHQEVLGIAFIFDDLELVVEALLDFGRELHFSRGEAGVSDTTQLIVVGKTRFDDKFREVPLAEGEGDVALVGNFLRIGEGLGQIFKKFRRPIGRDK